MYLELGRRELLIEASFLRTCWGSSYIGCGYDVEALEGEKFYFLFPYRTAFGETGKCSLCSLVGFGVPKNEICITSLLLTRLRGSI